MAKTSIIQRIKNWLTGGSKKSSGSKSSGSKSTTSSSQPKKKKKKSEEVVERQTERFNKRELLNNVRNVKEEPQKQEEPKPDFTEKYKATKRTYKSMSGKDSGLADALNKKVDKLSEIKESNKKTPPKPKSIAKPDLTEKQELIEKARTNRELKHAESRDRRTADRNARLAKRLEKHEAFHSATNHRYDVGEKGISKEERQRRIANVQTAPLGEMMYGRDDEALDVMKARMKYDRIGESARRGLVNATTANALNFAEKRFNKDARREAEEYYQANKHRGAEIGGSLAGGLLLYGGTAGTFENLGANAVGRAAETQLGKRLGAEALKRTMAGTGVKAAIARSLVGDAIQDSTLGLLDTTLDVAQRDDLKTVGDYAKAIAEGQAANYAMGLAGNAVAHGLPVAGRAVRNAWGNFADESRRLNFVPKGVADIAEATTKGVESKPKMKTVIANDLDEGTRSALITESNELDSEWWALRESIEQEYGSVNPNYRELTPEQQADVISKKTRMQEITARRNEIAENLRIVRRVEESPNAEMGARANGADADIEAKEVEPEIEAKAEDAKAASKAAKKSGGESSFADEVASGFRKRRSKANKAITERYKHIDEIYDADKTGKWVFYKDKTGQLCVGNPNAEHGRIRDGYGWRDNGDYFGKLTKENFEKAKKAFDEGNFEPYVSKAKKAAQKIPEAPEPKTKPEVDTLKTYKNNRLKENPDAAFSKTKAQKSATPEVKAETPNAEPQKVAEPSKTEATKETKTTKTTTEPPQAKGRKPSKSEVRLKEVDEEIKRLDGEIEKLTAAGEPRESKVELMNEANALRKEKRRLEKNIERAANARAKRATEKATKTAEAPKAETEPSEVKAKAEAKTTKTKNKKAEKATQESFDKDFAEFRKKIGNAKTDLYELENKLRVAETKEDKAAIRKQINALKDDVKKARNKAALRYSPDKGGSDEWMAKFNEAYDSFKDGSKGSKAPKGKAAKPQRTVKNVEDIVNKKRQAADVKEEVKGAWHSLRRKTMNSMVTFEDTNLKTAKTDHEGWKSRNAATDKTRRHRNIANISIKDEQLNADGKPFSGTVERIGADGKRYTIENGQSLLKIYKDVDESAFDAYLLLQHAPDRIREGTPIFDRINIDKENGETIESLNDPEFVKAEAERLLAEHPEFAKKAEELYQYIRNELENRVRKGLLSQEKASEWMHDHPFYVPTGRDGYFNIVNGNHKGVVGADPYKAAKGSDLDIRSIKEQLAEATTRNWRDITTNDLLKEFFGDKIKKGKVPTKGLKLLNETVGLSKSADGRRYFAKIWDDDGKMYRVEIDKGYYDDLIDLNKNGSVGEVADTVARATSKFSGLFKKLVTTWSPIFMPNNAARDIQDAIVNTRNAKEFAECYFPAIKQLHENSEFAKAYERSGVSQSNLVNLDEAFKNEKGGKLRGAANKFIALQDFVESVPRFTEYLATLKKAGININDPRALDDIDPKLLDIAAANAADVTVNFGRSGSVGKNLNKGIVPFFNPSLQGSSKFLRNFTEQRGAKQLLFMLGRATALGAGTMALNNFMLSDNPNYQQISARDKALNIIIQWPPFDDNTDLFIKIPRGRFAAVYALATANMNNDNDMGWAEMFKVARDQVLPVDPTDSSLFAPLYHVSKNETWYGAPIESDYLKDNFSPSERYDDTTTPLGKALGKATSGLPEKMQISPKKADYLVDATTGIAGDLALPMSTALARGDNPLKAGGRVIKKAFTIDASTRNDLFSRYDSRAELLTHKANSANATDEDKKANEKFKSWDNRVKAASKAMRFVQSSDMPNKEDAYRELAKLRNENIKKALDGKRSINNSKDIDIIHKYAGTSYTIENLGKSADKDALKAYGAAVYGKLSEDEMKRKIDSDTEFYKGYSGILKTQNALQKVSPKLKGSNALTYAVGLADAGANDDVFSAYGTTLQSRTETASKAQRAKDYLKNNGSVAEFAQLENAVKNLGKLSDVDRDKLEDEAYEKLERGEMSIDEYKTELKKIEYNANQSYVGKAVSLAMSGAPTRAYALYDIKEKNVQKGYNLAAMGIDSRKYREMSQACDTDGNGYLKTAEIRDYVANSDVEDKATLFDALCYYSNVRNPFGTPTHYSVEEAAEAGKRNGVTQIKVNAGEDNSTLAKDKSSGSGWYGGYYRRGYGGWHRWHRYGSGKKKEKPYVAPKIKQSLYKASSSNGHYKSLASSLQTRSGSTALPTTTTKIEPPKVKFKKYEV